MTNCNPMTKLKTTKFFIIGSRMIINNKKQIDYELTNLKKKGHKYTFFERQRKK
jgi:hypothetical protein